MPGQLGKRDPQRKYPILLTLLEQYAVDVLDETLLLFDQALSGRESAAKAKLDEALAEQERLPRDHGHMALMHASMNYLRQFVPEVLKAVRFAGGTGTEELLQAVSILTELYATGGRKVPESAPVGFVPTIWSVSSCRRVSATWGRSPCTATGPTRSTWTAIRMPGGC